jgi:hypothetical protein
LIDTAVIAGGMGHAPVDMNSALVPSYYENSGTQLMRVRYGEDANGLWFAGALWPEVDERQVAEIRASSISGDWRWHASWRKANDGSLDFSGSCLVNIPGFPMRSSSSVGDKHGRPFALAASASVGEVFTVDMESMELVTAGALPFKESKKADPSTEWDAGAVVPKFNSESMYRMAYAWVDSSKDPASKSSYKLPHHLPNGEVVLRGVHSAMARLMQSNTQIPASDRKAVYNHLAKHYEQFGEKAPDFHMVASAWEADMEDETQGCDGQCAECTCGKQVDSEDTQTDDEIIAAVYGMLKKRKKRLTADGSIAANTSTPMSLEERVSALESQVADMQDCMDSLETERLVRQITAQVANVATDPSSMGMGH